MRRIAAIGLVLVFVGLAPGWQAYLLAEDACPTQPDYTAQYMQATQADPNRPVEFGGLPILGPRPAEPNAWEIPCGAQRLVYHWCDPEGMPVVGEVVGSDIPAELTLSEDGVATLTLPRVTPEWHVVHVRLTDEPPVWSTKPATRDVLIVFRGQYGENLPPVLLGVWETKP